MAEHSAMVGRHWPSEDVRGGARCRRSALLLDTSAHTLPVYARDRDRKDHQDQRMTDHTELLSRITVNPEILGGKPTIRGLRIAAEHVLGLLAAGDSAESILREYPILEPADIQACLTFAYRSLAGEDVRERMLVTAA